LFNPILNLFSLSAVSIKISTRKLEPKDKKLFCKSKFSGHRGLTVKEARAPSTFPFLYQNPSDVAKMGSFTDESLKFKQSSRGGTTKNALAINVARS
jgi:hypothetical protein